MSLREASFGEAGRRPQSSWHAITQSRSQERLLVVNGHPDPRPERFCAALCQACLTGAKAAGRDGDIITLGAVFSADGLEHSDGLNRALELSRRPARMIVIFPLWLDKPPDTVTRFFRHMERNGGGASGRHAHIVVTMSLPAFAHRSVLREPSGAGHIRRALSLPGLEIDALNFVGSVDTISRALREEWLFRLRRLGIGRI